MTTHGQDASARALNADSLLEYEPFVRAVVRGLLSNEEEVRDVVQETWLRAIDRPPQALTSLRGWLAQVARNLARDHHRGASRRLARERAVARTEEAVEVSSSKLEAHRAVVDRVLALDEPYKTVVLLRYYQGRTPKQIAEQLERNPATVRSQLHRAHELLRDEVDAEYGGDRAAWAGLFLPSIAGELTAEGVSASWAPAVAKIGALVVAAVAVLVAVPPLLDRGPELESDAGGVAVGDGAEASSADLEREELSLAAGGPSEGARGADSRASREAQADERPLLLVDAAADSESPDEASTGARRAIDDGLTVLVQQDGSAVPRSEVWMVRSADVAPLELKAHPELMFDLQAFFEHFGTSATADGRGEVQFAWEGDEASFLGVGPGLQGTVNTTSVQDGTLLLALTEVPEVNARVVDARGKPLAGVPIALQVGLPPTPGDMTSNDGLSKLLSAESSADGLVTFRNFVSMATFDDPREPIFGLAPIVPGLDQATNFDPQGERGAPITLRLPPTVSVRVRAVDARGRLLDLDAQATLASADWTQPNLRKRDLSAGLATFEYVAPGTSLVAIIKAPSLGVEWKAKGVSPRKAVEGFTIDVVAPGGPTMAGRALVAEGSPMANELIHVWIRSEARKSLQRIRVQTDEEGYFRIEVNDEVEIGTQVAVSLLTHELGRWQKRADHPAALLITATEMQLGELVLRDGLSTIRGQCVDSDGDPVPHFDLSATLELDRISTSTRTDEEGFFTIDGLFAEEIELSSGFDSDWVVIEPKTVTRGSTGLQVQVGAGGEVRGNVQLAEDMELDVSELVFTVYSDDVEATGINWSAYTAIDEKDGSFVAEGLESGTYTCKLSRLGALLLEVRGVAVRASETTSDPRLESIDLRDAFESVAFRVATKDGKRVNAFARARDERGVVAHANVRDGEAVELLFPKNPHTLIVVTQPGYRTAILDPSSSIDEVVLEPGIQLSLNTLQHPDLRQGKKTARFSLVREDPAPAIPNFTTSVSIPSALASEGRASLTFPEPGTYRLHISISTPAGGGMMMASEASPLEATIEVRENDAGKDLYIELPEDLFEAE